MKEVLIGAIAGVVSGMGMGGGTILILLLTMFSAFEQHSAQATNLVFFIPTSIAAIIMNSRQKLIDFKVAIPVVLLGIVGAVIGAMLSVRLEVEVLRKCFGIFLAIIAIHEIYSLTKEYIFKRKRHNKDI